jgi:hypothetical protein
MSLEERIKLLEKRVEVLEGFNTNEVSIIEHEGTNSVYAYLQKSYPGLWIMQPNKNFVKTLPHPYEKNKDLTEFDGILILSNDPKDFQNPLLNKMLDENRILDDLYQSHLVNEITKHETLLDLHDHIVISNVMDPNTLISPQTLIRNKKRLEQELERLQTSVKITTNKSELKRIMVVIETKHHVTEEEVKKKLKQIDSIKTFVRDARKYYDIVNPLKEYREGLRRLKKTYRRKKALYDKEVKQLEARLNPFIHSIDDKLEAQNWTETFMNLCEFQNFAFEEVKLFMGGPLWESDKLKRILFENRAGVILPSWKRYEILSNAYEKI